MHLSIVPAQAFEIKTSCAEQAHISAGLSRHEVAKSISSRAVALTTHDVLQRDLHEVQDRGRNAPCPTDS